MTIIYEDQANPDGAGQIIWETPALFDKKLEELREQLMATV
jgi:hypothetical protein